MKNKKKKEKSELTWWLPNNKESSMLWFTAITFLVTFVVQSPVFVDNISKVPVNYTTLYPYLNMVHIFIICYIIYQMKEMKQLLPNEKTDSGKKIQLYNWIEKFCGEKYQEKYSMETIKDEVDTVNDNIEKFYRYWLYIWGGLLIAYVMVFIGSIGYESKMRFWSLLFNNIVTVFWVYIYLTLNLSKSIKKADEKKWHEKFVYHTGEKGFYIWESIDRKLKGKNTFGKRTKKERTKDDPMINLYRVFTWIMFIGVVVLMYCFNDEGGIADTQKTHWLVWLSVGFNSCAMLAAFSRLCSGYLQIRISALFMMLFYAAVQSLFFAENELNGVFKDAGVFIFSINLLCLGGKIALLFVIRYVFQENRIAYFFIMESIHKKAEPTEKELNRIFLKN
jgi:hypothetical protein